MKGPMPSQFQIDFQNFGRKENSVIPSEEVCPQAGKLHSRGTCFSLTLPRQKKQVPRLIQNTRFANPSSPLGMTRLIVWGHGRAALKRRVSQSKSTWVLAPEGQIN